MICLQNTELIIGSQAYRMRLDGVAYMTYVLMTIFVPLKLWCRRRAGGWSNIGWDDYLTVVALFIANGFFWTCMIGKSSLHSYNHYVLLTRWI
jgi:hypothetical protein